MKTIARGFRFAVTDESGVASIEYGVIAGFASIVIVSAITLLSGRVTGMYNLVEVVFHAL
jgi:Flp pilus assembly pilin Flp